MLLNQVGKIACPVCCVGFCRDRDMILIDGFYVCESELWDGESCGFSFPKELTKEEIEKAADEEINYLRERRVAMLFNGLL